ncbi:MAG: GNAT family N-acetyltransferase [Burkholderiaceae bacterium]
MKEIVVRRAEPSDAEGIASTFRSRSASGGTLQNPYPSVADWVRRLTDLSRTDYMLVATVDDEIVGNAGLHGTTNARRAHVWGIGMSVRDDWQGKGVGTRLMESLIDLADNWIGALRLELTVYCDNERALALYRKFGFEMEGIHRAYALRDGKLIDAHAMARLNPRPPQLPGSAQH